MPRIKTMTPIENSGLDAQRSSEIFDQIARFAGYGFNKSHAAAYAAISFQTAWLKTHHPEAFFAAAMNTNLDKVDDISLFINDIRKRGMVVWQPSVNHSRARFEPLKLKKAWQGRDLGICYGLAAIRGVGIEAAHGIEAERRRGGAFVSVDDFTRRMADKTNKTALQALAKAGAFDCLDTDRARTLAEVLGYRKPVDVRQISMFDDMDAAPEIAVKALTRDELLDNELDVLGHYMSGHPLDGLRSSLVETNRYFCSFILEKSSGTIRRASMPAVITAFDVRRTNAGDLMAVVTLSDPDGTYEALAFGDTWGEIRHQMRKKARVLCNMGISVRDDERRLIIEGVSAIATREEALAA